MAHGLFIGDVAKRVDMSVKTIRYYEGLGLLEAPERSESGYRLYGDADVERLRFIKGAKALGLSLGEIKQVLGIWGNGSRPCGHVRQLLDEKVQEITRRIDELVGFRDALQSYLAGVDAEPPAAEVPCRHIAGAAAGAWVLTPPEAVLAPAERKAR